MDNVDRFLGDVGIAMDQRHAAIVEAMRNSHQAIKDETRNKNMEERQSLHIQLEESLELLWSRLQKSSNSFKTVTEEKRRMYGELLGKDKKGVAEVVENNKKISKLMVSLSSFVVKAKLRAHCFLSNNVGRLPEVARHDSRDAGVGGEALIRPEEGAGGTHGAVEETSQVWRKLICTKLNLSSIIHLFKKIFGREWVWIRRDHRGRGGAPQTRCGR